MKTKWHRIEDGGVEQIEIDLSQYGKWVQDILAEAMEADNWSPGEPPPWAGAVQDGSDSQVSEALENFNEAMKRRQRIISEGTEKALRSMPDSPAISRRDYFAAKALEGMFASGDRSCAEGALIVAAVRIADSLIDELDQEEE